ncbi:MAG: helix-turn-helix transcriptional regulator [Lachnospiraceae bacterium]|nr:helix-turn-helix transcriptional regulator [Lachnospiraceae bacterium]
MTNTSVKSGELITPEYIRKNMECQEQEDGGERHVYRDSKGEVVSVVYRLYPGVTLIQKNVNRTGFPTNWREKPEQGIVIEHCWKGRMECQKEELHMQTIPGELFVFRTEYLSRMQQYPLDYFASLAISINFDELTSEFTEYLKALGCNMQSLIEKYRLDVMFFYKFRKSVQMVKIFEDIHKAPSVMRMSYYKLKLFELLVQLNVYEVEKDVYDDPKRSRFLENLAKSTRQYLLEHPYERITIEALAEMFMVSPSYLKYGFRSVYGISIKQFDREHKMQLAAQMLRETDWNIVDIARRFDYINASKFSAGFRNVHGMNPREYRKHHHAT